MLINSNAHHLFGRRALEKRFSIEIPSRGIREKACISLKVECRKTLTKGGGTVTVGQAGPAKLLT